MGTYHTYFVATDAELDARFPGWKRVKPEKVVAKMINPFTKETMDVTRWHPVEEPEPLGEPSFLTDAWGPPVAPIAAAENDYMRGIEEAGPPGLRSLPHFRAKNFDAFLTFAPLAKALAGEDVDTPPARVGHDEDLDAPQVDALPLVAMKQLAALADDALLAIAEAVLADFSARRDLDHDTHAFYVERAIRPLRALAVEALERGGLVCHYFALHP